MPQLLKGEVEPQYRADPRFIKIQATLDTLTIPPCWHTAPQKLEKDEAIWHFVLLDYPVHKILRQTDDFLPVELEIYSDKRPLYIIDEIFDNEYATIRSRCEVLDFAATQAF